MRNIKAATLTFASLATFGVINAASAITLTNPTGPVPANAGTGLLGNYYGDAANSSGITNTDAAMTYIHGHSPVATFKAKQVNYPGNLLLNITPDTNSLTNFLGTDAASLSNPGVAANHLAGQLMDFTGYLAIKQAGTYKLGLGSDDGSRLLLGGQMIVDNHGIQPYTTRFENVTFTQAGLYPIEVAYFETTGTAGVALYGNLSGNGFNPVIPGGLLYGPGAAVPEPGSVALLCGAGIGGSLLAGKRRRVPARRRR